MARGAGAARKKSLDPKDADDGTIDWDWENASTPLVPKGKEPKFIKPADKFSSTEGETVYCFVEVVGDPVPEVTWFKASKDLATEPRCKIWTKGPNQSICGFTKTKQDDEGAYRIEATNEHGTVEHEFSLYVTVAGGMDFRAMLMRKKKPAKKVVEKVEWIEEPVDRTVKQGTIDQVTFRAKLSVKGKKAKWYIRNQDTQKSKVHYEHGVECYKGAKYSMETDEDTYTLTIKNPEVNDGGRYTCVIRECNDLTSKAYLEVEPPDPEFKFAKKLDGLKKGKTTRKVQLKCKVDNPDARVKWFKDGKEIKQSDPKFLIKNEEGVCTLDIRSAELADSGDYKCVIQDFGKEGENETNCKVEISEFQHAFTSQLKGKQVVEDETAVFELGVEEDDAPVKWFKDGVEIVPDGKRIQIISEGKKRKLVIKNCKLEDSGMISAKTTGDEVSAPLEVKHHNGFKKGMRDFKQCVEREPIIFNVELKDPNAPADFFINGEPVDTSDGRIEVKNLGDGKHQLIIHNAKMGDAGTVSCKTPSNKGDEIIESKSNFTVVKGEDAPTMGAVGPVTGTAKKACAMTIPYKVEGEKQSDLEIIVEGPDGKVLKMGKDANLTVHGDRVQLDLINPTREKSGKYKVIMKNAQGSCEQFIDVNIMDKPTPPQTCKVTNVFQDNCVVNWTPPKDDGGTPLRKYVVEALDTTNGNATWSPVASTDDAGPKKIKVENLTPGHKYRFRVRAVNKIGESEPCEMLGDDILMKDPWDEPDPCGKPNIVDWSPNHADLTWDPPESDGGAPITHYIIEQKEKNMGQWVEGKVLTLKEVEALGNKIKGKIDGLVEGCEYQFRVKAVNKGGPSKPGPPSDSMIAKHRFIPPHLLGDGIYDITLKKGRPIRYDLWFGGEPAPSCEWIRNGRTLTNDDNTSIELYSKNSIYTEKNTVLSIPKADRARDTGKYTIKLVCEAGTFEATGNVNVLDVPSKPRAINPDEVRAEHVKLSWMPPEDDGGTPITSYLVRYMDIDSGEWVTACTTTTPNATATGLKPGHLYQFEVSAINKEGQSEPIFTGDPILAENPYRPPSAPGEPKIVDFDNKSVTLRWEKPKSDGGRPISHYIIQKKDKFGGWFDALITDDQNCVATIDELEARVPGLSEGKWYQFRVIAVNKAGESDPSPETKPHLCRHKNLSPSIDKGQAGSKTVRVGRTAFWQIRCRGEPPPTFTWVHPVHGELSTNENYSVLTDEYQGGAITTLVVHHATTADRGTYTLQAENRNGKEKIDLDLIVLEKLPECDCDMYNNGDKQCSCQHSYTGKDPWMTVLTSSLEYFNGASY